MIHDPRELKSETPVSTQSLVEHFFRHQWGAVIARLSARFGAQCIEAIEDSVQDALIAALHSWPLAGLPDNPAGWVYTAAQNRLIDRLRRDQKSSDTAILSDQLANPDAEVESAVFSAEIPDEQLALMFACADPALNQETQAAVTLRYVCGLDIREIAAAFLTGENTIAQRIHRGRKQLRSVGALRIPTGGELPPRIDSVLGILYLLFSEGYSSHHHENLIRFELCAEAFRIATALADHPAGRTPNVFALLALFSFQLARLPARVDTNQDIILLADQDRTKWDSRLLQRGLSYLEAAGSGRALSRYHLEAGIAACHAAASDFESTNWRLILEYYDILLERFPSPVYSLNRAVAVVYCEGATAALELMESPVLKQQLDGFYLYHAVLADLYGRLQRTVDAASAYRTAIHLATSASERRFLARKLAAVETAR